MVSCHFSQQSESKHKQGTPKNGFILDGGTDELDPLDKKGLDGLLNFINGTDKEGHRKDIEKELTAKAAKRARQKQKKVMHPFPFVLIKLCFYQFQLYSFPMFL